jgi:hypothetical protein
MTALTGLAVARGEVCWLAALGTAAESHTLLTRLPELSWQTAQVKASGFKR